MSDRLESLRELMASHTPSLTALIVPSEDYHQSEYVSERDKRREYVSGFSGSAGLALITMTDARLWTDGRYFLQAMQELNEQWKLMRMGIDETLEDWISNNLPINATFGVDAWCISVDTAQKWEKAFVGRNQRLVQTSFNLVDQIWKNRPTPEVHHIVVHPAEFAGKSVSDKLKELREDLVKEKAYSIVVTSLDQVAWLFNIRGGDVAYSPVFHAFAIVTTETAFLYVDNKKVSTDVQSDMDKSGIEVRDYHDVGSDIVLVASQGRVWVEPNTCYALYSNLKSDQVFMKQSPLALAKALKNPIELDGFREAHKRDGAAVVQFFAWLDKKMQETYSAPGYFLEEEESYRQKDVEKEILTEVSVSDKLESFRASKENFRGLSFPTISSVGSNAAIIHYQPEPKTCAELAPKQIYLCDSGAQYLDGTTDITRTVHFGKPSAHEKACYTAVLKGHIALDTAVFPNGTTGYTLDTLARAPLWKKGLDYRHGTGHGVGSYLNVHEGPQSISFRENARDAPLQASMTVTDEPGYYEDGSFGIRLENVLIVKEADTKFNFGEKGYLCFEHITWVPFQIKLIELSLLTSAEIEWLNEYHSRCLEVLAPYLDERQLDWLKEATHRISM